MDVITLLILIIMAVLNIVEYGILASIFHILCAFLAMRVVCCDYNINRSFSIISMLCQAFEIQKEEIHKLKEDESGEKGEGDD